MRLVSIKNILIALAARGVDGICPAVELFCCSVKELTALFLLSKRIAMRVLAAPYSRGMLSIWYAWMRRELFCLCAIHLDPYAAALPVYVDDIKR